MRCWRTGFLGGLAERSGGVDVLDLLLLIDAYICMTTHTCIDVSHGVARNNVKIWAAFRVEQESIVAD